MNDTRSKAVIRCAIRLGHDPNTGDVLKILIELYELGFAEGVRCADRAPVVHAVGDER